MGICEKIIVLLAVALTPSSLLAEQLLLFDKVITHTGEKRWYQDWDFAAYFNSLPGVTQNWLEPVNYADGKYHIEVDILSMGDTEVPMNISIGWNNHSLSQDPTGQHCTITIYNIERQGLHTQDSKLRNFWHGPANSGDPVLLWDFTHAYQPFTFFTIVAPLSVKSNVYFDPFPLKMDVKLWLVSEGSRFQSGDVTGIDETETNDRGPVDAIVLKNYPNPFNPKTTIEFTLPEETEVILSILNLAGQKVSSLVNGSILSGRQQMVWRGMDKSGNNLGAGQYIVYLETESVVVSHRIMLVR